MNRLHESLACQLCDIQPHHKVLEVGFGPGLGLKEAASKVYGGPGSIHGIDISEKCLDVASQKLRNEIVSGRITLHLGSVTKIPYGDNTFDSIFHCNSYYYWPNMDDAIKELHRVIKNQGVIVTTLPLERLKFVDKYGLIHPWNMDPDRYMISLNENGFVKIDMKTVQIEKASVHAIVARAKK